MASEADKVLPHAAPAVPRPNDAVISSTAAGVGSSAAPNRPVAVANNSSVGLSVSIPRPLPISGTPKPVVVPEAGMRPYLSSSREPIYPPEAARQHTGGAVVLNVVVTKDGAVRRMDVVEGSPVFVKSALASVSRNRYRPYLVDGKPVEVETRVRVNFPAR